MNNKFFNEIVIFEERCCLGEGCQISENGSHYAWVDINKKKVFIFTVSSKTVEVFNLESTPSAILELTSSYALILDDIGLLILNFEDNTLERDKIFIEYSQDETLRANDGLKIGQDIVFGTMKYEPSQKSGIIYLFKDGCLDVIDHIGIPNTFIMINDKILISDSLEKVSYIYDIRTKSKQIWHDFSNTNMTPDGGCIGPNNNIFICLWGDGSIGEFSSKGTLLKKHMVSVEYPTNCIFTVDNKLLVTSANQNKDNDYKKMHSNCGRTLILS